MNLWKLIGYLCLLPGWGSVDCPAVLAGQPPTTPNVLFLLTDDQAVDTLAAWGVWGNDRTVVQTPHLDRMVARGVSFTRAYNMGSVIPAVCVCSRGMLITGRSLGAAERLRRTQFAQQVAAGTLWPQRMKAAGYQTWMSGKWHVDAPVEQLFDQVRHVRPGMPATVEAAYQRPRAGEPDEWLPWDTSRGGYWEGGRHWSEVVADDAGDFLAAAAQRNQPFFLYLAFNAPHDPRQAPREYLEQYPPESVPLPANFLPLHPHYEALGLGPASAGGLRDEMLAPFPRSPEAIRLHRREYYALVTHLDAQIGRILDALERTGLAGRTVVIFTSDHGLAVGRHGLLGKQNLYEHSLRVPFVIAGPGIPEGQTNATPIYLQDAMATALELAGGELSGLDFRSVLPLLRGERDQQYERIHALYLRDRQRCVIDGEWKLIEYPGSGAVELFHLGDDPEEQRDRSADPALGELVARLRREAREWAERELE